MSLSSQAESVRQTRWENLVKQLNQFSCATYNVALSHSEEGRLTKIRKLQVDAILMFLEELKVRAAAYGRNNHSFAEIMDLIRQVSELQ